MKNSKNQKSLNWLKSNFNQLEIINDKNLQLLKGGNGNEENAGIVIEDIVMH